MFKFEVKQIHLDIYIAIPNNCKSFIIKDRYAGILFFM